MACKYGFVIQILNIIKKDWFVMEKDEMLTKAYFEEIKGIKVLHIKGKPYEMGYQHGYLLADKIVHIHASNNDGSEDQHFGVEDGNIDYVWFAETLKKIGYDKSVIVESMHKVPESIQKLKHLLA